MLETYCTPSSDSSHWSLYFSLSQKIFRDPSRESFGHLVKFKLHDKFFGIPTLRQLRNGLGGLLLNREIGYWKNTHLPQMVNGSIFCLCLVTGFLISTIGSLTNILIQIWTWMNDIWLHLIPCNMLMHPVGSNLDRTDENYVYIYLYTFGWYLPPS